MNESPFSDRAPESTEAPTREELQVNISEQLTTEFLLPEPDDTSLAIEADELGPPGGSRSRPTCPPPLPSDS